MPFSRGPLLAPAPPPAPRWPQFGYLAEAPRGNYALFHGPRPRPLRLAPQAPEFGPFGKGQSCLQTQYSEVHSCPPPLPRPPDGPSLVIWLRPLEATMRFSMVPAPPQAPEVGPQAPEFGPFEFCVWRQLCPFPEVHFWPPPAPRWPQFGYLAEAPRGNYALFHGPRPRPLRLAPQAPMFGPFGKGQSCLQTQNSEDHCWPPAPRWPQFGYLAEAPRGNYAFFHGPRPAPGP